MKKVPYKTLEIAPYLTNSRFHIDEKMLLFKLRTSMINVKGNFKSGFDDTSCGFCQVNVLQTQEHLLSCMGITKHCQALQNNIEVVYSDLIQGSNKQLKCVRLFKEVLHSKKMIEEGY